MSNLTDNQKSQQSWGLGLAKGIAGTAADGLLGMGLGMLTAGWQDKRQLKQQQKLQDMQIAAQKDMAQFNQGLALDMWKKTGPTGQKEQLKAAGLNPALMYGMGGGTGGQAQVSSGNVSGGNAAGSAGEIQAMMQLVLQNKMTESQIEVNKAQARNIEANTAKTQGVDTTEAETRVINNQLESIIKQYTGKEAAAQFNIKEGWRGVESETYGTELEARQASAKVIYDLWIEGKLHDKSNWEIEKLLLNNAKTSIVTGKQIGRAHV